MNKTDAWVRTELWFEDEPYPILVNPKHIVLAEPNWLADAPQGTTKLTLVGGRHLLIAMPFSEFAMLFHIPQGAKP